MNLFFLKKVKHPHKLLFKNKDKTISNEGTLAEVISSVFENAIKSLNISPRNLTLEDTTNFSNPVEIAIKKFENNPRL